MKNKELILHKCWVVFVIMLTSIAAFYPSRAEIKHWWGLSIITFVISLFLLKPMICLD